MAKKKQNFIETLFPTVSATKFKTHYWLNKYFCAHAPLKRLPEINSLSQLKDIGSLLSFIENNPRPGVNVRAWFQDPDHSHSESTISASAARDLYKSGKVTAVVDSVHLILPAVQKLIRGLGQELDPPDPGVTCNVYASPKGEGTVMHFDQQEVFLLQLKGKKRWRIAPNKNIKYPTQGYFGHEIGDELAGVCKSFPKRLPKNADEFILKPGSVLYLPRGTWHESLALEESLGITLTLPLVNWADYIYRMFRKELLLNEEWRKPVMLDFETNSKKALDELRAKFAKFIEELQSVRF